MKQSLLLTSLILCCGYLSGPGTGRYHPTRPKEPRQPNVILIIADDLGYSDLASYGNQDIATPNIDSLGTGGVRFTHAYVTSPICSPSRMAIMTGRYQNRYGGEFMPYDEFDPAFLKSLRKHYLSLGRKTAGLKTLRPHISLNRSKYTTGLPLSETTLAELLKKNGYSTGLIGKWNMGEKEGNHPSQRGFDQSYYFDAALTRYVDDPVDTGRYVNQHLAWAFSELPAWQPRSAATAIREDGLVVKDTGYLTFSLAARAVKFIDQHKDRPFFLTLTFNAPHDPFQAPRAYYDRIAPRVKDRVKRVYYGMIEALDDAVGQVTRELNDKGLAENTMIIFVSDNGGATYTRATDNAPLRGGKCTHFEGGLLVPFFIKYAGHTSSQVYDKPVSSLDIFATIAAHTNTSLPLDRTYDGLDLLPYLSPNVHSGEYPHELLYWRSGYSKAICKGDWKLYLNEKDHVIYLFDLSKDIAEMNDLSASQPARVRELLGALRQWEKTQTTEPAWPSASDVIIDVRGKKFRFPS